jgi:carboxymethylenebutenolidase
MEAYEVSEEQVSVPSGDGQLIAHLARPAASGRFPAVLLSHDITGLSEYIMDLSRRLAREGFVALVPGLYSRDQNAPAPTQIQAAIGFLSSLAPQVRADPGAMQAELAKLPAARASRIGETLKWLPARNVNQNVADLEAARRRLAGQDYVLANRVGSLGFCMGGGLSNRLAATGADLAACVIFYGENPPLDQVPNIRCPVLGLYGGEDHRVTDTVPQFAQAMQRADKSFEYHVYPGARHAFHNDTGSSYQPEAAADAWRRALSFLHANLG